MRSEQIYRSIIAVLVLAVLAGAWLVFTSLSAPVSEKSTPRTAAERAILDASLAVKMAPNSLNARLALVKALAAGGDYSGALDQARRAEILERRSPELAMVRGSIYAKTGATAEAIKWLRKAAADKDQGTDFYVRTYTALAEIYKDENRLDEAAQAYGLLLRYAPISAPAYQGLGEIYERQEKPADALKAYKTAYDFDRQNKSVLMAIDRLNKEAARENNGAGEK